MILTYPTQNLVKNRHWGTYIVLIISNSTIFQLLTLCQGEGWQQRETPRHVWIQSYEGNGIWVQRYEKNIDIDLLCNGGNVLKI